MQKHIQQLYHDDCGYASLKMLLCYYFHHEDYLYLSNPKDKGSYSFLELVNEGKKWGIYLKGYQIDDYTKLTFPCLALIKQNEMNHIIMVLNIKKNKVYIKDPSSKKKKMSLTTFLNSFSGYALIIDKVEKTNTYKEHYVCFPKYIFILGMSINLVEIMLFYIFYMANPFWYIIFFTLVFFSQLVLKRMKLNLLKKKVFAYFFKDYKNKNDYQLYLTRINNCLYMPFDFIDNFFILGITLVLAMINKVSLLTIISITICIIFKQLLDKISKKNDYRIAQKEETLFVNNNDINDNLSAFYSTIEKHLFSKSIIEWSTIMILSFFILMELFITKNLSISRFLYVFFISLGIYKSGDNCLSLGMKLSSYKYLLLQIKNDFKIKE